jgi:hypothetical protein
MSNANLWVFLAFFKSSMVASCNILSFYMYMLLKNLFNDIKFKVTFRFLLSLVSFVPETSKTLFVKLKFTIHSFQIYGYKIGCIIHVQVYMV